MPGTLRPDAHCPVCGDPLIGIVDATSAAGVVRKYFHGKDPERPKCRRALPCKRVFSVVQVAMAGAERRGLELQAA